MSAAARVFSEAFQRLYCDPTVYEPLSRLYPISLRGVLPFRTDDPVWDLTRHRMVILFASCGLADDLIDDGNLREAKRLLQEANLLEPKAEFITDRLKRLP